MIDGSDSRGLYGASGELRKAVADIGDGKTMTLSGPFSFDEEGYLSGSSSLRSKTLAVARQHQADLSRGGQDRRYRAKTLEGAGRRRRQGLGRSRRPTRQCNGERLHPTRFDPPI
jgi:hypothetical protein